MCLCVCTLAVFVYTQPINLCLHDAGQWADGRQGYKDKDCSGIALGSGGQGAFVCVCLCANIVGPISAEVVHKARQISHWSLTKKSRCLLT